MDRTNDTKKPMVRFSNFSLTAANEKQDGRYVSSRGLRSSISPIPSGQSMWSCVCGSSDQGARSEAGSNFMQNDDYNGDEGAGFFERTFGSGPVSEGVAIQKLLEDDLGPKLHNVESKLDLLYVFVTSNTAPREAIGWIYQLQKHCINLMKYIHPGKSMLAQVIAFKWIVILSTQYPGIRLLLRLSKHAKNFDQSLHKSQYDLEDKRTNEEWQFYKSVAIFCLSDSLNVFGPLVEDISPAELGKRRTVGSKFISVVELLFRQFIDSHPPNWTPTQSIAIRYLSGILRLRTFWKDSESFFVALELLRSVVTLLRDIVAHPIVSLSRSEETFHYSGVADFLKILVHGLAYQEKIALKMNDYDDWWKLVLELKIVLDSPELIATLPDIEGFRKELKLIQTPPPRELQAILQEFGIDRHSKRSVSPSFPSSLDHPQKTKKTERIQRKPSEKGTRHLKVTLEDPVWKVLPAALKKYKISDNDWQNYVMFINYTSNEKGEIERCLCYDEKPLLLFQRLKDTKKNPKFVLKHVRDIPSPISQVKERQAIAKPSDQTALSSNDGTSFSSRFGSLQVGTGSDATGATGNNTQDGYDEDGESDAEAWKSKGISFAVAIYPFVAEQNDEFAVALGETFVILQRGLANGWWVAQRDPLGTGRVKIQPGKQGWVPVGCFLETSIPVKKAMDHHASADSNGDGKPILPQWIVSTNFPGIALWDYAKRGDAETSLKKNTTLRVYKAYHNWSYIVKEETGQRGWVPSWLIGKIRVGSSKSPSIPQITPSLHTGDVSQQSTSPIADIGRRQ